jgi:hypothetical protein
MIRGFGLHMLFSRQANLLFAHFPKTAGTSLTSFLQEAMPDVRKVDPTDGHLSVREARRRFYYKAHPVVSAVARLLGRRVGRCDVDIPRLEELRVLGVVREPFEMCVSLFNYWRVVLPEGEKHHSTLASAATRGDFKEFARIMAHDGRRLSSYRDFFDLDGPFAPRTYLVDFAHLREGLDQAFQAMGLKVDLGRLPVLNKNPSADAKLRQREDEVGELAGAIRQRFRLDPGVRLYGAAQGQHGR